MIVTDSRLATAYSIARNALLAERNAEGFWVGELSSSALSTAVAVIALHLVDPDKHRSLIANGLRWLVDHQNADGGWGDTTKSFSNISTAMLCRAAFAVSGADAEFPDPIRRGDDYLTAKCGRTPAERAEAIRQRYGKDRTFSVPILMTSALAGLVPWNEVPRLPFELACLPQSWYRFVRLPVVSYALPALIAIGQCVHHHRGSWNPVRTLAKKQSLRVLRRIQPSSGGYLEATPLTAFVVMALASVYLVSGGRKPPVERATPHVRSTGGLRPPLTVEEVISDGVRFLVDSVRPDGSWPIDTNLSIWVTTLSVNALAAADDLASLDRDDKLLAWLLSQQTTERHPFTGAEPGAWGWSHCPGSVPDCDDTPGAVLALNKLALAPCASAEHGEQWIRGLQNRDGGFPTFCRGWGALPFDRSGSDLTAHALRALGPNLPALDYLARQQRADGSWLPLWFGNQHAPDDENPVYGTARVLAAYRMLCAAYPTLPLKEPCQRGATYLLRAQNPDGGWGGAKDCPSSVEETALAVEVLIDLAPGEEVNRGIAWLIEAVESGQFRDPSPIGFYFAKLWYFEKLYPLIFTVAALGRALRRG